MLNLWWITLPDKQKRQSSCHTSQIVWHIQWTSLHSHDISLLQTCTQIEKGTNFTIYINASLQLMQPFSHLSVFLMILLQVLGCHIWDDRRRWKRGCSFDSINFLQRVQIFQRNWNYSHGCHDRMLHPPNISNTLPTMGWDVLWSILRKDCHRRRLLLVWMELKREGKRSTSGKLEICW